MNTYIIFLRAVNVGGNNRLPMNGFRVALKKAGFENIKTYIQSGNVVLSSKKKALEIMSDTEKLLQEQFDINIRCFVFSIQELIDLSQSVPFSKKQRESGYIIFTSREVLPEEQKTIKNLAQSNEIFFFSKHGIFISYPEGYGNTKVHAGSIEKKLGVKATARNMRTFYKTLALANE